VACPFFRSVLDAYVEEFQQAVFVWKSALGFSQLPELSMHRLNRVGGVYHPPNVGWIFEIDRQIGPGLYDDGIFGSPFFLQVIQCGFGPFNGFSFINRLQICHELLLIFASHIFQGIADLMDDAELNLGLRKDRIDHLWKAREAIDASNQYILPSAVIQVCQY